jgi:hypothetical protein
VGELLIAAGMAICLRSDAKAQTKNMLFAFV